jgi:hypothetical protein
MHWLIVAEYHTDDFVLLNHWSSRITRDWMQPVIPRDIPSSQNSTERAGSSPLIFRAESRNLDGAPNLFNFSEIQCWQLDVRFAARDVFNRMMVDVPNVVPCPSVINSSISTRTEVVLCGQHNRTALIGFPNTKRSATANGFRTVDAKPDNLRRALLTAAAQHQQA